MKKALLLALPSVEPLEARIAPATLTFVDIDGDQVTITTSKGTDADLAAAVNPFLIDSGAGKLLQKIDLASNAVFKGTNLSITAEVGGSGDGLVDIGYINATGLDLGRITVDGGLGQIDAGDSKVSTPGLKALEVGSLGALGTTTQNATEASLISSIQGALSSLVVAGDVRGTLDVSGGTKTSAGRIGTIEIGGSLIGDTQQLSGSISASGAIGSISVQGLQGGTAANTGYIEAASINSLTIEKSIIGGDGEFSGAIRVRGDIRMVEVGEDIIGGLATTAHDSGEIRANGTLQNVSVGGKVQGGGGTHSGAITSGQGIGTIQIDNGLIGGEGFESGAVGTRGTIQKVTIGVELTGGGGDRSGAVLATSRISDVTVNGDVTGGGGDNSGVIATDGGLVKVTINGSVKGGAGDESGAIGSTKTLTSVYISGNLEGGGGVRSGVVVSSTSIGSVTVDGSVIGGTDEERGSIGSFGLVNFVKIGGDLQGGDGYRSGSILSAIALGKIEIDGSLIGGPSNDSGIISTFGVIGSISIANNLEGGGSYRTGLIEGNRVNNVRIGGNVFGGGDWLSGSIVAVNFGSSETPGLLRGGGSTGPEPLLGTITVRGDVYGGDGPDSGSFISDGQITSITIGSPLIIIDEEISFTEFPGGGSLHGGSGYESGSISARGNIGTVTIFGDLIGGHQFGEGSPYNSGGIAAGGNIQKVFIGRDLRGGDSSYRDFSEGGISGPGQIYARARIGSVEIGGSVIGSYGEHSATIWSGALGRIKVMGSVFAGPGEYSASFVADQQDIQELRIAGELTNFLADPGFEGMEPGFRAASIAAARTLGQVDIGSIYGDTATPVMITAGGKVGARSDTEARAIGTLIIHNSSSFADILAGYDIFGSPVNPDAQIGTVTVGAPNPEGEPSFAWESTNVAAGVVRGIDGIFGTPDDLLIGNPGASSKIISKIARVVINGTVVGGGQGTIMQGIVAEQIGSVFLQGEKAPLHAGPHNDTSVTFPFEPSLGINEPKNTVLPALQD